MSNQNDLTPDFDSPEKINVIVEEMQQFENRRGNDRAIINDQFNGAPPFSHEEAVKLRVEFNINFNEGGKLLDDANRQVNGALLYKPNLAILKAKFGKPEKRAFYSGEGSQAFNLALQRGRSGRRMMFLLKNRNASCSLHGIGALMWGTSFGWRPRFIPLADLLIPTDTNCDLEDLSYFCTNYYLSQGEFFDMVGGEDEEKGWNRKAVYQVLHFLQRTSNKYADPFDPVQQPEKWVEYRKQNRGFYYCANDEVPKVALRAWYYKNPKTDQWYRKVLLRFDAYSDQADMKVIADKTFLYESKEPFAQHLSEMLHIQYGDISRVPPLKHHSVRGLGVELFGPVQGMNRIRCQFMQHVFTNLLTWFRINEPADRDRLKHFILEQFAAVPAELEIVKAADRYQIDPQIVEMAQSQFRQLMNESSSSFVRDIDSGSKKEMTLGEAQIRLQQVNVQVSSMLRSMYAQEVFLYEEILRRFLIKGSTDKVVETFQKKLSQKMGEEALDFDNWQVDVETVLGNGDQTAAQIQANLMLSQKMWMDPESARQVERDWLIVTTGDASKAKMLVPESENKATSGSLAAQDLFGTLMQGTQVPPREGIDQKGYIDQMFLLAGEKVKMIESMGNVGTMQEVIGLTNVLQDITSHVALFARDPANKQQSLKYWSALKELQNLVKGFAQRLRAASAGDSKESLSLSYKDAPESIKRQMEMKAGFQPANEPVTDPKMLKAQHTMAVKQMAFVQKQKQEQIAFQLEEVRKSIAALAGLDQEQAAAKQKLALDTIAAAAEALRTVSEPSPQAPAEE